MQSSSMAVPASIWTISVSYTHLFPHLLGTDEQCRDYLVRILYGTRVSLFVGFFAAILVLIIGLIDVYKRQYQHSQDDDAHTGGNAGKSRDHGEQIACQH